MKLIKDFLSTKHTTFKCAFVPLNGGATAGMNIFRLPTNNYTTFFSGVFRHISNLELLFGNVQTIQNLFTMFDTGFEGMRFLQQNLKVLFVYMFYTVFVTFFMSVGWDVKWCPASRITILWHTKDRFSGSRRRVGSETSKEQGPPTGKLPLLLIKIMKYGIVQVSLH